MGRRDRARADHVGALTGFCSARRRPKRTGDRQGGGAKCSSARHAGRVHDRLERVFGRANLAPSRHTDSAHPSISANSR